MTRHKTLISIIAALCVTQSAVAVVADPQPVVVTQADGTTLTVIIRGDERCHITFTQDGYPLLFNNETGNYEYADADSGRVKCCGIIATDISARSDEAISFLQTQDKQAIIDIITAASRDRSEAKKNSLTSQGNSGVRTSRAVTADESSQEGSSAVSKIKLTDFPTIGEQHSLVILVEFSDQAFSTMSEDAATFYYNMLNEEGFTYSNGADGSARDFYVASSAGAFLPVFDVVGPVTLPESYTYYGQNDIYGNDIYAGEFVVAACEAADSLVDFSQYDTNGDGYVDNVYFFYAGRGEADGGGSNTIWPHSANLEEDFSLSYTSDDGVKIGDYSCSNEARTSSTPAGIGTFVHEFGHTLGLADHYSTTYGTAQYVNPGEWDTMASGNYNNDCHTPPTFSAFERAELGWLDYTDLDTATDTIVKLPLLADNNIALRVSVSDDEFYVMENRQLAGWDAYLPGHGMLVWHIDYDEEAWESNTVNTDADHQRVDIVEADGVTGEATYDADPFPGTGSVMEYDFYSWDDTCVYGIEGVSETYESDSVSSAIISFILAGADVEIGSPAPLVFSNIADESFTVGFSEVESAAYYLLNISSAGGNDTLTTVSGYDWAQIMPSELTKTDSTLCIDISGVEPATEYSVSVVAGIGAAHSDTVTANVITEELYFSKRAPQNVTISDVTSTSFTANWDAVDDADNYILNLSLQSVAEETTTEGYDFSSRASGMPDLWYCNHTMWISTSGHYGEGAPALALSSDGDYLRIAYPDTKITALQFWCMATAEDCGTLYIDIYAEGSWQVADTVTLLTEGATREFSFEQSDTVRLRFSRTSGRVYIDDVYAECHAVSHIPAETYDGTSTSGLTYTFSGLEENGTYVFTVTAAAGDSLSLTSDEVYVYLSGTSTGISEAVTRSDGKILIYDMQGRRMNDARALLPGVYIVRKDGKTIKVKVN